MNALLVIWTISVCLPYILAGDTEEQCDIYGALVNKPGRICICDQRGVVRCKPRMGGRFLVCIMDVSSLGADVQKIYDGIAAQKKTFREYVVGGKMKKEPEEKVDPNFDPPDFTMTERPGIAGGIGDDEMDFGKGDGGEQAQGYAAGGDYEYDGGDAGRFRRLNRQPKGSARRVHTGPKLKVKASEPKARAMFPKKKSKGPKNSTKPRGDAPDRDHWSVRKRDVHRKAGRQEQIRSIKAPVKSAGGKHKVGN